MKAKQREFLLKILAGVCVGMLLLNYVVITPLIHQWEQRRDRIAALRKQVEKGRLLMSREKSVRSRWKEFLMSDLPDDSSKAENEVFRAVSQWARDSRVALTSLTPQWQTKDPNYQTLEVRVNLSGDQSSMARFLYELEISKLPIRLEECEISGRDDKGRQLTMTARFTALRLNDITRNTP